MSPLCKYYKNILLCLCCDFVRIKEYATDQPQQWDTWVTASYFPLQAVWWTRGSGAGAFWRTRPSCGFGPSRRLWSRAGCTKRGEAHLRCPAETGNAAGSCCGRARSCTLRTTARRRWRGCWTCTPPSKDWSDYLRKRQYDVIKGGGVPSQKRLSNSTTSFNS